jgi:hypothetical protein
MNIVAPEAAFPKAAAVRQEKATAHLFARRDLTEAIPFKLK